MLSNYRELRWVTSVSLDADSNLISWGVERRFMSQYAPCHARQFVGERNSYLVAVHAF